MVKALQDQLRIPSKEADPAPGAPFGPECRRALDHALSLAEKAGFRTKNLDGYAGHAEFGEGPEMVMALCHLDVVPEGDGWKYDPYGATIDDGYIYARGAGDDKGPSFAAYFAACALKETGVPIKRRVRIVFGCNEESGFRCVKHYFEHEEAPTYGFAPDAGFPLIYAEKGIANLTLTMKQPIAEGLKLVSGEAGSRPNIVPQYASATLTGADKDLDKAMEVLGECWDKNITYSRAGDQITIKAQGKPAHGAAPFCGDSAVNRLFRVLTDLPLAGGSDWIDPIYATGDTGGVGLGIHGRDEVAGELTSNWGLLSIHDGVIEALYNIRYPVEWTGDMLLEKNAKMREKHGWELKEFSDSKPLFVPLDREPVKTILSVCKDEGIEKLEPGTMGGGTYARAVPNTVAIGAGFPGDGPGHEANERIAIASYIRLSKIYAHILYRLASL